MTGKIKLVHSGGNSVSLAVPTSNPSSSEVAFKLPQADGSANQVLKTDGSGNLAFATVADTNDYVKLQQANGTSGGSEIIFDNLDVATYRYFDLVGVFRPANDTVSLRFRYREGGSSGSNITSNSYAFGFTVPYPTNNTGVTANTGTKLILSTTIGNHSSEGIGISMRISTARSGDDASAKWLGNFVSWNGVYREQSNGVRLVNGQGHLYDDTKYPTGFSFHMENGDISNYFYTLYGIKG